MKEHVSQWNSLSHVCVFYRFCTTMWLGGTEEEEVRENIKMKIEETRFPFPLCLPILTFKV